MDDLVSSSATIKLAEHDSVFLMFLKTPSTGLKCYDFFCFYISYGNYADGPHDVFTVDYVAAVIDLTTGELIEVGTIEDPMSASRILELAEQLNQ